jgi:membrane-bound serine protease (ClpP class)
MSIPYIQIDLWLIILVIVAVVAFVAFATIYGVRAHRQQVSVGREELIGKVAEVATEMEPRGMVRIYGEQWAAILEKGKAEPGEEVIITKVEGLKLRVTKKEQGGD